MDVYPQPLVGWKVLGYDEETGALHSRDYPHVLYESRELEAECQKHAGHIVPEESCKCGLWALWEPTKTMLRETRSGGGKRVLALVWGYGNWEVNELSWRAEKQKLAALCSDGSCESVELLGAVLGVPALTLEEMREYASYAGMKLGGENG